MNRPVLSYQLSPALGIGTILANIQAPCDCRRSSVLEYEGYLSDYQRWKFWLFKLAFSVWLSGSIFMHFMQHSCCQIANPETARFPKCGN